MEVSFTQKIGRYQEVASCPGGLPAQCSWPLTWLYFCVSALLAEVAQDPCTLCWFVQLRLFFWGHAVTGSLPGSMHWNQSIKYVVNAFTKPSAGWLRSQSSCFSSACACFSGDMLSLAACQRLLRMTVQRSKTSPASIRGLLASITKPGTGCMLPQGLLLPEEPSCACVIDGLRRWACVRTLPSLALERQKPAPPYHTTPVLISHTFQSKILCFQLSSHNLPVQMGLRLRAACVACNCPVCPGVLSISKRVQNPMIAPLW